MDCWSILGNVGWANSSIGDSGVMLRVLVAGSAVGGHRATVDQRGVVGDSWGSYSIMVVCTNRACNSLVGDSWGGYSSMVVGNNRTGNSLVGDSWGSNCVIGDSWGSNSSLVGDSWSSDREGVIGVDREAVVGCGRDSIVGEREIVVHEGRVSLCLCLPLDNMDCWSILGNVGWANSSIGDSGVMLRVLVAGEAVGGHRVAVDQRGVVGDSWGGYSR